LINAAGAAYLAPIAQGAAAMTVDAAVNGFVRAASTELTNDVRINVVAPGVVEDSPQLFPYFPGHIRRTK